MTIIMVFFWVLSSINSNKQLKACLLASVPNYDIIWENSITWIFQKLIVKHKCLQEEVDLILTTVVHFVVAGKKAKPTDTVFGKIL